MGRMTWDLATLQNHCSTGRAGWEADSDYIVDKRGRLAGICVYMPRSLGRCRVDLSCGPVASEVLPCCQGYPMI